jgi:putative peptide zinc metalloprotease protein
MAAMNVEILPKESKDATLPLPSRGSSANNGGDLREQLLARLASLSIGLRRDLEVSRQVAGGEVQYVIRDPLTFNSFSLTSVDYQVFQHLEHMQTVEEAFQTLSRRDIVKADQKDDFYRFIVDLQRHNLIFLPILEGKSLYERFKDRRKKELASLPLRLISFQIPLFNPDRFLDRTSRFAWPLFQKFSLVAWIALGLLAIYMLQSRWTDFSNSTGSMLALRNVPILLMLLCLLKAWHELGHAYACKIFGGTVPEVGLFFIAGTPCAYVDASAAWGFRDRWQRIAVNLAGMYFESLIAIAAVFVWSLTPPGLIHSIAHYTIVISTVVTILFNANPLLKFDGYYVLCDWLNIPNLKKLSTQAMYNCAKRLLLGLPVPAVGETWWSDRLFTIFGVASEIYKVFVTLGIFVLLSMQVPAIGLMAALFYLFAGLIPQIDRLIRYLLLQKETQGYRRRACLLIGLSAAGLTLLIVTPIWTAISFTGVVGYETELYLRSPEAGFVRKVSARPSQSVQHGQPILELSNDELQERYTLAKLEVSKLKSQLIQSLQADLSEFGMLTQRIQQAELDLKEVEQSMERLTVRAPQNGVLTDWNGSDFDGRFFQTGEPILRLVSGKWVVRALATDEEIADSLVRVGDRIELEVIGRPGERFSGQVIGVTQVGQSRIDEIVLTQLGGGDIDIDPQTKLAQDSYFAITVEVEEPSHLELRSGIRVQAMAPNRKWSLGRFMARKVWQFYHRYLLG